MKAAFSIVLLAILLFAAMVSGATIEGPEEVDVGKPAWYKLTVAANEKAFFLPLPGSPISLDTRYIVSGSALFWAPSPGNYHVTAVCVAGDSWENAQFIPLSKTVLVKGVEPPPDPPQPDPPDPPNPGGKYQVSIFYETFQFDNMPRSQQVMLHSMEFRKQLKAAGHTLLGIYDIHILDGAGAIPPRLAPFVQAASGDSLPRICLAPKGGGTVKDFALPADSAATFELIRNGGL